MAALRGSRPARGTAEAPPARPLPAVAMRPGRVFDPSARTAPTPLRAPRSAVPGWIAVAFLLAAAGASLYLAQVSFVATAGYELQRLEEERKGWIARNQQLELELAKRHSLAWAERQAVERFGMVPGEKPIYIAVGGQGPLECLRNADCGPGASGPPRSPAPQFEPTDFLRAIDPRNWLGLMGEDRR